MTESVQNCPLCGSNESTLFDQRSFHGHPVTNRICRQCGLVYQSPRMTDAECQAFYEEGYRSLYQGQESPKAGDLAVQEARAKAALTFLAEFARLSSPALDIGCSAGILLKQIHAFYQVPVFGVEPGRQYREYARSAGIEVYPSVDELQATQPGPFSLVSMMHVLEHLPNPLDYLHRVRESLLDADGWLLLEVPNLYAHDCFEVAHLVSFSAHTLTQLVEMAGFNIIRLRAHGLPRSRLVPLYLTLLARPAPITAPSRPVEKELGIKLKRRIGLSRRRIIEVVAPRYAWQEI